jgi:3-phenylpropionate/trans-cinnamate dioxygenase ferredoxin reductase subunit
MADQAMHADNRCFVIVGAGQAGRWLALTLRAEGFAGRILWFGDEAHPPYDRPPLSKAVIQGDMPMEKLALLQPAKFDELHTEWHPNESVVALDREHKTVRTESGAEVRYDALFLANGGRARTLPGLAPHPRIATLRTWEDALAIKAALAGAQHIIVIGGGWIGLELAASSRKLGKSVTVLEAAPRLCIRTVPACVSEHLRELHQSQGVALRLGAGVTAVEASDQGIGVTLSSGERVAGDFMVLGIGLVANDGIATAAGLATGNGVLTDAWGRSSDPAVYAVGDVANALRSDGQRLRIESWENAQRQAVAAAKAALGLAHDPDAEGPPWFWSDQFDDNLQILGFPDDRLTLVERSIPAKRQRLLFFCDGERVRAVAAINAGREIKIARKWLLQDRFPAIESLADAGNDLNKLPLRAMAPANPLHQE